MPRLKRQGKARPRHRSADAIRRSIRAQVDSYIRDLSAGRNPDPATVESVEQLETLLRAQELAQPTKRRRSWPVVLLVILIAMALWTLMVVRVPTTEVSLALDASSVTLRVGKAEGAEEGADDDGSNIELTGFVDAARIAVDDVDAVSLDFFEVPGWQRGTLEIVGSAEQPVTLRPIYVPPGTRIAIRGYDASGTMGLDLAHPTEELELTFDIRRGSTLEPGDTLGERLNPAYDSQELVARALPGGEPGGPCAFLSLRLQRHHPRPASGEFALHPGVAGASEAALFPRPIPADALYFREIRDPGRSARPSSTVLGGALFLEEIGGTRIDLRRHQDLWLRLDTTTDDVGSRGLFTELLHAVRRQLLAGLPGSDARQPCVGDEAFDSPAVAPATISRLLLAGTGVRLEATGIVDELSTGTSRHRRDLMPSFLERLRALPELPLFWGAFGSIFGLLYTVLMWLRGSR